METITLATNNEIPQEKRIEKRKKRIEKRNRILVLIDWENLFRNMEFPTPEKFSMVGGLDKMMKQLAEIGEVIGVFVFLPLYILVARSTLLELFYKLGFYTIVCPKIKTKEGEEKDTVEEVMNNFSKYMMDWIQDLTHLCIGSGDKDLVPLAREAIRRGLKIIVVTGSLRSLSQELSSLVDVNDSNRKMIYIFSPQN